MFFDNKIINFRGDLSKVSAKTVSCSVAGVSAKTKTLGYALVLLFSKFNKIFFGYTDPEFFLLDNKNR